MTTGKTGGSPPRRPYSAKGTGTATQSYTPRDGGSSAWDRQPRKTGGGWSKSSNDPGKVRPQPRPVGGATTRGATDVRSGIVETARALGMPAEDLATFISYETGGTMNPRKRGPTTRWGQHRGLIQFGETQARQYGVDFSSEEAAIRSQLGADGAIVRYFRDNDWQPGMGLREAYAIINTGTPRGGNRSDAGAGGAAGTANDKVARHMGPDGDHRAAARRFMGATLMAEAPAQGGSLSNASAPTSALVPQARPEDRFTGPRPQGRPGGLGAFTGPRPQTRPQGLGSWAIPAPQARPWSGTPVSPLPPNRPQGLAPDAPLRPRARLVFDPATGTIRLKETP